MHAPVQRLSEGFTLIELMVVVALLAILGTLVGPSFQDMILKQRLRGVNAELVTDLQFARAEAIRLGRIGRFHFRSDSSQTCYSIYYVTTDDNSSSIPRCDCLLGAGTACTDSKTVELKTVILPRASSVTVSSKNPIDQTVRPAFGFDPITGGLVRFPSDDDTVPLQAVQLDTVVDDNKRHLRVLVVQSGRPTVCAPSASTMQVAGC